MRRWVVRGVISTCVSLIVAGVLAQSGPLGFVGAVDLPDTTVMQTGVVIIRGFAFAVRRLTRIELYVDGVFQSDSTMGLPRIDVVERYTPQYPYLRDASPGFQAGFLASRFRNGPHSLWLKAYTSDGRSIEFGRRTITIDNAVKPSALPFFNMPDPGGIARITAFLVAAMIFVLALAAPRGDGVAIMPEVREPPRPSSG